MCVKVEFIPLMVNMSANLNLNLNSGKAALYPISVSWRYISTEVQGHGTSWIFLSSKILLISDFCAVHVKVTGKLSLILFKQDQALKHNLRLQPFPIAATKSKS